MKAYYLDTTRLGRSMRGGKAAIVGHEGKYPRVIAYVDTRDEAAVEDLCRKANRYDTRWEWAKRIGNTPRDLSRAIRRQFATLRER